MVGNKNTNEAEVQALAAMLNKLTYDEKLLLLDLLNELEALSESGKCEEPGEIEKLFSKYEKLRGILSE